MFMKNFMILILMVCVPSLSSCRRGCMDENACNFDSAAKRDNGTCNYGCLGLNEESNSENENTETEVGTECSGSEVQFMDVLATKTINCFDYIQGSPNYGNVFAVLTITQNRYATCSNGYFNYHHTEHIVSFKNVSGSTVSFDYQITQNHTGNYKYYQNVVSSLPSNSTDTNNTGQYTFYNMNNSSVQVVMASINYE